MISSRPGALCAHVQDLPRIIQVEIAELNGEDVEPFLRKIGTEDVVVQRLVQAIEKPQVENGAVNVGWNQATTLKQLLEALETVIGALPAVSYGPARSGDIRHSRANNRRLLERFATTEQTPMSVGLARLLGR